MRNAMVPQPAIACREYGKPAVVGTGNGTKKIKDGRRATVDGGKGIVLAH